MPSDASHRTAKLLNVILDCRRRRRCCFRRRRLVVVPVGALEIRCNLTQACDRIEIPARRTGSCNGVAIAAHPERTAIGRIVDVDAVRLVRADQIGTDGIGFAARRLVAVGAHNDDDEQRNGHHVWQEMMESRRIDHRLNTIENVIGMHGISTGF